MGLNHPKMPKTNLQESFGLANLQKRAEHLKKLRKQQINLQVIELRADNGAVIGTKATITMQLEQEVASKWFKLKF